MENCLEQQAGSLARRVKHFLPANSLPLIAAVSFDVAPSATDISTVTKEPRGSSSLRVVRRHHEKTHLFVAVEVPRDVRPFFAHTRIFEKWLVKVARRSGRVCHHSANDE